MSLLKSAIEGEHNQNNHSFVVGQLGRDIVSGRFPPGSLLPNDAELLERFKVSRTVLREALKTLSAKGMLVARARIGTRVTEPRAWSLIDRDVLRWHFQAGVDKRFLEHLADVRIGFEPQAARLAARCAEPELIEVMRNAAEAMCVAETDEAFALADLELHMAVLEASGNPFMLALANVVEAAFTSIFTMSYPVGDTDQREEVSQAHMRIVDAIEAGDEQQAWEAMIAVIDTGRARTVDRVTEADKPLKIRTSPRKRRR